MFNSMNYVYEVYKERSFSKAAANLYISQPSLSAAVKKVEEKIGAPIFDRSVSPIKLTDCGRHYIKAVEEIMDIQNQFETYMTDINELKTGQVAIGGSNLFASYILPPIITKFTQKYPLVKVHLIEANTPQLIEQLFHGSLDLVIDNSSFPDTIYQHHLYTKETLLLAVPKAFPSNEMASGFRLTIEDILIGRHLKKETPCVPLAFFKEEPFIFLRSGNDTRSRADKICQAQSFTPNIILKLDQQVTAFNVCCYGMGVTFVSDSLLKHMPNERDCFYYKVHGSHTGRNIYFYHKQTKYVTRAMEEFLKVARKQSKELMQIRYNS